MVRISVGTVSLVLFCASCSRQVAIDTGSIQVRSSADQTRVEFERLAAELPYLTLRGVLYYRPDDFYSSQRFANPTLREVHNRIISEVTSGNYSRDAVLEQLSHPDPKVRTLAAVALFDREDPFSLPLLVKLCADYARTFDGRPELAPELASGPYWGSAPPPLEQYVSDVAREMLEFYMKRAGFHYKQFHPSQPGFAEYWSERKGRSHCASWFAVQLARASQGTSPPPNESLKRIRGLRRRIDALPLADRAWVLLRLNGEDGGSALVTETEMLEA